MTIFAVVACLPLSRECKNSNLFEFMRVFFPCKKKTLPHRNPHREVMLGKRKDVTDDAPDLVDIMQGLMTEM